MPEPGFGSIFTSLMDYKKPYQVLFSQCIIKFHTPFIGDYIGPTKAGSKTHMFEDIESSVVVPSS